ncbi:ATP-binding protein [Hoyosella sp. YIM 151337]|uniref:ATP-binding protein n=1 Tax=Hoyosella sp. YIM 151337 TaxID=2992742 RepID=UPI002235DCBC|nr:ATP-binding protein [Hoyosella sp. YIM 151337]MCW4353613.1 ATP-binding protein [Hoyosella sp. YIM 151337]
MMDRAALDHKAEERVELSFPATLSQLSLARLVTVAIMSRADFDGDSVEDLRMAMDEACTQLIARAPEGAEIRCTFTSTIDGVIITVASAHGSDVEVQQSGLGWHIIEALTDSAVVRSPGGANGARTSIIELRKRKGGTAP